MPRKATNLELVVYDTACVVMVLLWTLKPPCPPNHFLFFVAHKAHSTPPISAEKVQHTAS